LSKKYVVLSLLLVFILTAGLSMAQSPENNTSKVTENNAAPAIEETLAANSGNNSEINGTSATNASTPTSAQNNASEAAKAALEIAKMKGIWSISGIEQEQITMALKQDGGDIFGEAKYEPDGAEPWNAIAIGTISEDNVALVVTALKGKELVSARLNGIYANETISGKFFEVRNGSVSNRGDFSATLVNPEISEYTPAKVTEKATIQPEAKGTTQTTVAGASTTAATENQTAASQTVNVGGRQKPVDVHMYAEKMGVGGDLSGVPPLMGGLL
jgi:hypothetical protein